MAQEARIKLTSTNLSTLEGVCSEIKGIGEKNGIKLKGPHPLPTKKMKIVTRKSPCGQGTNTYDKYEMRVHRRVIDLGADDRSIRQLMRLKIPDDVYIEVSLTQQHLVVPKKKLGVAPARVKGQDVEKYRSKFQAECSKTVIKSINDELDVDIIGPMDSKYRMND